MVQEEQVVWVVQVLQLVVQVVHVVNVACTRGMSGIATPHVHPRVLRQRVHLNNINVYIHLR